MSFGILLVLGCGGPRTYPVSGTVTLDGKPLPDGNIYFSPPQEQVGTQPANAAIKDGQFHLQALPGKNRVEVRATREVPGTKSPFGGLITQSIIPAKYNSKTTLAAEVTPDGQNQFKFELKSH